METFQVTAELSSPLVIGGGYFTLDALLGGILFEQLADVEKAHDAIPIRSDDGLFHASAAQIEPHSQNSITFVANMRADHAIHPDLLQRNRNTGRIHRRLGRTRRQDFGAVLNKYTAFNTADVIWYAEGDPVETERLLSEVQFIGKRRGSGFGEVKNWRIDTADFNGLTGPFDEPLRPVPIDRFKGDKESLKVDAAWRPAYWHPDNRALCFAPRPLV